MSRENFVRRAAVRNSDRTGSFEIYAWYFMRVSGAFLLVTAVFHLMYMHFAVPGGVAAIDHAMIVARWSDPVWGVFWRTFDLLLLIFGVIHGGNGIRYTLADYLPQTRWHVATRAILFFTTVVLIGTGTIIVFSLGP